MAKIKQPVFSAPLLRRSASASSAAAASAASKFKSNLSTITKLPKALKRNRTNGTTAAAPSDCVPLLSRSSTMSFIEEETKVTPTQGIKFGISSLKHIRTSILDKRHFKAMASNDFQDSPKSERINKDCEEKPAIPLHTTSAIHTASRFVMGVPTLLRRAVNHNHVLHGANASTAKTPDGRATLTKSRGDYPEDDLEENDRHSLLMMLQVPEATISLIPLMAVGEVW